LAVEDSFVDHHAHVVAHGRLSQPHRGRKLPDQGPPAGAVGDQSEQLQSSRIRQHFQASGHVLGRSTVDGLRPGG
jgi:hypothetical protein